MIFRIRLPITAIRSSVFSRLRKSTKIRGKFRKRTKRGSELRASHLRASCKSRFPFREKKYEMKIHKKESAKREAASTTRNLRLKNVPRPLLTSTD